MWIRGDIFNVYEMKETNYICFIQEPFFSSEYPWLRTENSSPPLDPLHFLLPLTTPLFNLHTQKEHSLQSQTAKGVTEKGNRTMCFCRVLVSGPLARIGRLAKGFRLQHHGLQATIYSNRQSGSSSLANITQGHQISRDSVLIMIETAQLGWKGFQQRAH